MIVRVQAAGSTDGFVQGEPHTWPDRHHPAELAKGCSWMLSKSWTDQSCHLESSAAPTASTSTASAEAVTIVIAASSIAIDSLFGQTLIGC